MLTFLGRRLFATIPVMVMVALFVFMMLRLTPSDPAAVIAGDYATTEQIAAIRDKLGLNRAMHEQFFIWIGNVVQGDFGESFFFKKTVASLIAQRLEPTVALALITIVLSVLIAVPMGVLAAWRQGTWVDRTVMGFSVAGFSVPVFVFGYALIFIFSVKLGWLPVQGYVRIGEDFFAFIERMILPAITLSVIYIALIARISRASVLEVLNEDYIRTARAKGLTRRETMTRHALRNALIPVLTILGLQFAFLLAGGVIIENVFYLPGLGRMVFQAIAQRDLIVVQGIVMVLVFAVVVAAFLVDLAYAIVDPRLKAGGRT